MKGNKGMFFDVLDSVMRSPDVGRSLRRWVALMKTGKPGDLADALGIVVMVIEGHRSMLDARPCAVFQCTRKASPGALLCHFHHEAMGKPLNDFLWWAHGQSITLDDERIWIIAASLVTLKISVDEGNIRPEQAAAEMEALRDRYPSEMIRVLTVRCSDLLKGEIP